MKNELLLASIIFGYAIFVIIFQIILNQKYLRFYKLKITEDPLYEEDLGIWQGGPGKWHGDTFYFRTPMAINDNSRTKTVNEARDKYNKLAKLFWTCCFLSIPIVLIILIIFAE